ncbi:MAG: hypothetical protein CO093_11400 [Alphaproteobacteria bacterium CG_4_9_14_3_um_filter_47_13]|nr:MAG: hypothetical protein CO093_11400 [Alphaproteobacteria bacterium CG_4_9_14_3_um_filter_47_13]
MKEFHDAILCSQAQETIVKDDIPSVSAFNSHHAVKDVTQGVTQDKQRCHERWSQKIGHVAKVEF